MSIPINNVGTSISRTANNVNSRVRREEVDNKIKNIDNKIQDIDVKIEAKEKLITLKQDQVIASKEFIGKCDEEIAIIKELIDIRKQQVSDEIGIKQKKLDLLQESRDLTKESRDLLQKMIAIGEKMESIMMKNPAKYGGLPNSEIQKLPEIKEAKSDFVTAASAKVEQYPKGERIALAETVKNVVDATFTEVKPADVKANRELFNNLGKRIEAALDKKHETLATKNKDIRQIMDAHYHRPLESFARMSRLAYLDLAIKDMKV